MNTAQIRLNAFADELEKIAKSRAVAEWRQAQSEGNAARAGAVAQTSAQLGLKPRFLEPISGGGIEAGVDKMMGHAGTLGGTAARTTEAPNPSGLIARKLYKPDSPLTVGPATSQMIRAKQTFTDTARGLSSEAKEMMPAMYGSRAIRGGGQLRHISEHEYVPDAKDLGVGFDAAGHAQHIQETIGKPMAEKGMVMGDIPRPAFVPGEGMSAGGNASNAVLSGGKPRVIDFVPVGDQGAKGMLVGPASNLPHRDMVQTLGTSGSGRGDTAYGGHNMDQLRKDVYRPQKGYTPPPLPVAASATPAQSAVSATAGTLHVAPAASGVRTVAGASPIAPTLASPHAGMAPHLPVPAHVAAGGLATAVEKRVLPGAVQEAKTLAPGLLRRAGTALSHTHL